MKKSITLVKIMLSIFFVLSGLVIPGIIIPGEAHAENLTIQFTKNTYSNGQYNAYFSLNGNISYDTIDAIRNGITAKLLITFQLTRSEGFMGLTQNILREKIEEFNISYDVWDNTFIIEEEGPKKVHQVEKMTNIISKIYEVINPVVLEFCTIYPSIIYNIY